MTPSRAHFARPGDETRSGAQDLRRGLRHSAGSNRPWSAPRDRGLNGTLASNGGEQRRLRRPAGRPALRAVRNACGEHLPDLRRMSIGWKGGSFVSQSRYAQCTRRSRREWMGLSPSMRLRSHKHPFLQRVVGLESNPGHPDQRFAGKRAHGGSECEEARSSAPPFRARRRESAARGRADSNDRWLHRAALQRSATVGSRAK